MMFQVDEARFEQLVQAETKLRILYCYITKNEYICKNDILKMMDWEPKFENNILGGSE